MNSNIKTSEIFEIEQPIVEIFETACFDRGIGLRAQAYRESV